MFRYGWKLVVLIIVAVLVFVWLMKAPVLSSYITGKMGIPVNIGSISIGTSKTTMHRFTIDNPPGFNSGKAFEAHDTILKYRFDALKNNPSEIDLIVLDGVTLNIEIRDVSGKDNNWAAIIAKIPKHKSDSSVLVHKLILRNMTVVTQGAGANKLGVSGTRHFDEMQFDEINSADGFPTEELIARIFGDVGLMKYIENLLNPTERIKNTLQKPFKMFGG